MFHSPFQRKLMNLREKFLPSELYREEAIAFAGRLPHRIEVKWVRDGKFIIGNIIDGDETYLTQAKSAKELVDMVNDVIYSVYGVKQKYFKVLGENKYRPTPKEFSRLSDRTIPQAEMGLERQSQLV